MKRKDANIGATILSFFIIRRTFILVCIYSIGVSVVGGVASSSVVGGEENGMRKVKVMKGEESEECRGEEEAELNVTEDGAEHDVLLALCCV